MLNIAVIGIGNISKAHIGSYLQFADKCRLKAFVDIVPEKAEQRIMEMNLKDIEVYESHRDILNRTDIDLVSICTPPDTHAQISIDCLEAGFHVIVEKPMAPSLEECDAILAAEKKSGKILSPIAQNRFRNEIMALKKTLDSGKAGNILHAQIDSFWWRSHAYYDLWWRGRWETEGGGCTLNHAVHHIDMLAWMMGMPESVVALLSNAAHNNSEVEDISVAAMVYKSGAMAQVTSSVIHHGEEQQLIFQCEKARISAPWKVVANQAGPNAFPLPQTNVDLEESLTDFYHSQKKWVNTGHAGQIEDVMDSIIQKRSPFIAGIDGRNTIEMITAIYKAAALGQKVDLPIAMDDKFYTNEGLLSAMPRFYEKSGDVKSFDGEISLGSEYTK